MALLPYLGRNEIAKNKIIFISDNILNLHWKWTMSFWVGFDHSLYKNCPWTVCWAVCHIFGHPSHEFVGKDSNITHFLINIILCLFMQNMNKRKLFFFYFCNKELPFIYSSYCLSLIVIGFITDTPSGYLQVSIFD